jgi:mRNA interferase RelE/StbE
MGKYRLAFKKSVAKDLRGIPKKDVARILKCFDALAEDPRASGCEKLSGQERYRIRRGVYRIVYEIRDDKLLVIVVKVGHRPHVY